MRKYQFTLEIFKKDGTVEMISDIQEYTEEQIVGKTEAEIGEMVK